MSKSKQTAVETSKVETEETTTLTLPTMSKDEYVQSKGSKSAAIRALLAEGHKRGPVAKYLGIKYQFVRNVDITPVKKV